MSFVTFACELCGTLKTERACWHKKREHHFCSRLCANRVNSQKKATGLTRKEYEKRYWEVPENKSRRAVLARVASVKRQHAMGDSVKKAMVNRAKARAAKVGIPFDIRFSDFELPKECPVLGTPFEIANARGGSPQSPSLDRIFPDLGYVKGNVRVISNRANRIKTDASIDEIEKVIMWLRSFRS